MQGGSSLVWLVSPNQTFGLSFKQQKPLPHVACGLTRWKRDSAAPKARMQQTAAHQAGSLVVSYRGCRRKGHLYLSSLLPMTYPNCHLKCFVRVGSMSCFLSTCPIKLNVKPSGKFKLGNMVEILRTSTWFNWRKQQKA